MKKAILNTRKIRAHKKSSSGTSLQMLTCYDFQTAQMFNESNIDLLLVGDSLGNVMLGHKTTVEVSMTEMEVFGSAVKRGAPDKFVIVDMPFGSYSYLEQAIDNATILFQRTKAESLKIEGAFNHTLEIIKRLTAIGIPIMGHIGLTPQSVHELGGYFTHGKSEGSCKLLIEQAKQLEQAGVYALVLECVAEKTAAEITNTLGIPTIGIGAGRTVDGQVLVINDLLKNGPDQPPKFCTPITDFYDLKKNLVAKYLHDQLELDGKDLASRPLLQ